MVADPPLRGGEGHPLARLVYHEIEVKSNVSQEIRERRGILFYVAEDHPLVRGYPHFEEAEVLDPGDIPVGRLLHRHSDQLAVGVVGEAVVGASEV